MEKSTVLLRAIRKVTGQIATLKTVEIDRQIWRITTYQNRTENQELKPPWKIVWGKKILIVAEELLEAQGGKSEK